MHLRECYGIPKKGLLSVIDILLVYLHGPLQCKKVYEQSSFGSPCTESGLTVRGNVDLTMLMT